MSRKLNLWRRRLGQYGQVKVGPPEFAFEQREHRLPIEPEILAAILRLDPNIKPEKAERINRRLGGSPSIRRR